MTAKSATDPQTAENRILQNFSWNTSVPILMPDPSIIQMVPSPNADEQIVERERLLFTRFSG